MVMCIRILNIYELEIWFLFGDLEKDCYTEIIEADTLKEAIGKVKIRHPYKIFYNGERVY